MSLLGRSAGEDILKRDQVWFVTKNEFGESSLYPLSDFRPRQEENRERRYLSGSYGAVPMIDDTFTLAIAGQRSPSVGVIRAMRVTPDLSTAHWRKSSYSGGEQGDECVEVCDNFSGTIPVRDSKNATGPVLLLPARAWQPFVNGVKDGSL